MARCTMVCMIAHVALAAVVGLVVTVAVDVDGNVWVCGSGYKTQETAKKQHDAAHTACVCLRHKLFISAEWLP